MKIFRNKSRNAASVLLLIVLGTLALVVGAVLVYNLVKIAKRIDGNPYHGGRYTNDESIIIPPDNHDTNFIVWWDGETDMWFEWDDTIPYGSAPPDPAPQMTALLSSPTPVEPPPCPVVYASLNATGGVVLAISWDANTETETHSVTFRELGMPVDSEGLPTDLSWSSGKVPTDPGENWNLQRSTNLVDWELVVPMQMRATLTNAYWDKKISMPEKAFYRAIKP